MPITEVTLASTEQSDLVGRLLHDFNAEFQTPGPAAEELAARFKSLLLRDDVLVLLAGDPAAPAGFAFLTLRPTPYYDGPLAQLEELYVRPGLRDRGIGTALLTSAVLRVRERGAAEVHINVAEADLDTRRFYERHGFVNIEPGQDYRMLCYLREL
jgi:GNAT superfamily N-acetyltransferase